MIHNVELKTTENKLNDIVPWRGIDTGWSSGQVLVKFKFVQNPSVRISVDKYYNGHHYDLQQ